MTLPAWLRRWLEPASPPVIPFFTLTRTLWGGIIALFLTAVVGDTLTTYLALSAAPRTGAWEGDPIAAFYLHSGIASIALAHFLGLVVLYVFDFYFTTTSWRAGIRTFAVISYATSAIYALVDVSNLMTIYLHADLYHWFVR